MRNHHLWSGNIMTEISSITCQNPLCQLWNYFHILTVFKLISKCYQVHNYWRKTDQGLLLIGLIQSRERVHLVPLTEVSHPSMMFLYNNRLVTNICIKCFTMFLQLHGYGVVLIKEGSNKYSVFGCG